MPRDCWRCHQIPRNECGYLIDDRRRLQQLHKPTAPLKICMAMRSQAMRVALVVCGSRAIADHVIAVLIAETSIIGERAP